MCQVLQQTGLMQMQSEKVENNDNLKEYFKEKDWDNFNDEQIIFKNDTINICVF